MKVKHVVVTFILFYILAISAVVYAGDNSNGPITFNPITAKDVKPGSMQATKWQLKDGEFGLEDFILKGVQLGQSINEVQARLGVPKNTTQSADGISYDYGDIELLVGCENDIIKVCSNKKLIVTRRSIHAGSSLAELKQAYGESYQKVEAGELDLYEYSFSPAPRTKYLLCFAINRSSNVVNFIECRAEEKNALAPVRSGGEYGYIDTAGQIVIIPQFDSGLEFYHGLAIVRKNEKVAVIDTKGNMVIEPLYDSIEPFSDGLACVGIQDEFGYKYGFVNKNGTLVIPTIYDFAKDFSQGLAAVDVDGKKGYIDTTGRMVIDPKYEAARSFSEGLAAVNIDGKYGYIDKKGNLVIDPQFEQYTQKGMPTVTEFSQGLAAVAKNDKWGYIDPKGNMVIEPQFSIAKRFMHGLARVVDEVNGKMGYINLSGKMVIEFPIVEVKDLSRFSEGLAALTVDGKICFINTSGAMVIKTPYEYPRYSESCFSQGRAPVMVNGKYGYINTKGDMVIMPRFQDARNFSGD